MKEVAGAASGAATWEMCADRWWGDSRGFTDPCKVLAFRSEWNGERPGDFE